MLTIPDETVKQLAAKLQSLTPAQKDRLIASLLLVMEAMQEQLDADQDAR